MKCEISILPFHEMLPPEYMTKVGDQVSSDSQGKTCNLWSGSSCNHVSLQDFSRLKIQRRQVQVYNFYEQGKLKAAFLFHTILIASLNVTLNSFNLLAWLLSFLLHACSGGEPSSKSSWVLSKKMINKRKKKPVTTHNRIPCHTLDDSHTFT